MSEKVQKSPTSIDELVGIVRQAKADNHQIEIIGAGSKRSIGQKVHADIELSTLGLSGIDEYTHSELVMSAKAGTPLSFVETALKANNQMLAFEPASYAKLLGNEHDQTIGGVFAANMSGPRRLSMGAARDGLLGVKFINGNAEKIKSGGKVMKNVTGLDLVKLFAGSWGTLGVMSDVTFKVLPRPETMRTLIILGLDDAEASKAMALAMAQTVEVSSAAHIPSKLSADFFDGDISNKSITAFRLEGLEASVDDREQRLHTALKAYSDRDVLDADQSARLWKEIADVKPFCDQTQSSVWKISVAPTIGHQLVAEMRKTCDLDAFYDWQGGLVWMRLENGHEAKTLRQIIKTSGGGHATLIRADEETRAKVSVFEPMLAPVAMLSERIKLQFDPDDIFNSGRMSLNNGADLKAKV
jgi:glycolate oxidase FAD binding subunit